VVALLKDMFHRGNSIDVAWFLVGAWLLAVFVVIMARQLYLKWRRKTPDAPKT